MATSKCPRCDSTFFEAKEANVSGSDWRYMFIQCASCGSVVGVQDIFNVPNMISQLARGLNVTVR